MNDKERLLQRVNAKSKELAIEKRKNRFLMKEIDAIKENIKRLNKALTLKNKILQENDIKIEIQKTKLNKCTSEILYLKIQLYEMLQIEENDTQTSSNQDIDADWIHEESLSSEEIPNSSDEHMFDRDYDVSDQDQEYDVMQEMQMDESSIESVES